MTEAEKKSYTASVPPLLKDSDIPENEIQSWQNIIDLMAQISGVRAGLIIKAQNNEAETLIVSNSPNNPYETGSVGALTGSGMFSEKVVAMDEMLLVPNASQTEEWRSGPSIKYGLTAFLGFPIHSPDGSIFGTICLLDDKTNSFSELVISLTEKMRDLIESHLKLLHLNAHDQLTGLYNRAAFNRLIIKQIEEAQRNQTPLAALMLDIDHFKEVNDDFGHLSGDEILKNLSRLIRSVLSGEDIAARFGGEEFIVLLPMTAQEALGLAEKIRSLTESANWLRGSKVTVSIGVAEYRFGEKIEAWLKRADDALYKAKNNGRNRVEVYDETDLLPSASVHFIWKGEWASGSSRIDSDHVTLLQLGNRLINSSLANNGYDKILVRLDELLTHIFDHFKTEERIISEAGYPEVSNHIVLHKKLSAKALTLKEAYIRREIKDSAFFSFLVDEVIVGHMEKEDTKFFETLKLKI